MAKKKNSLVENINRKKKSGTSRQWEVNVFNSGPAVGVYANLLPATTDNRIERYSPGVLSASTTVKKGSPRFFEGLVLQLLLARDTGNPKAVNSWAALGMKASTE